MIVGSGPAVLKTVHPGQTTALLNTDVAPTGTFQSDNTIDLGAARMRQAVVAALDGGQTFELPASQLATELTGDSIGTNLLMLGYAAQKGLLPLSMASIQEAIRLNGTFVQGNLRTFNLGRLAAQDSRALAAYIGDDTQTVCLETTDDVLASRTQLLTDYQNAGYAKQYVAFVQDIRRRVRARSLHEGEAFVRTVALTLARLMAYKDEYEVARLYTAPIFMQRMQQQFAGDFTMSFQLAPPFLPGRDASGRPKKRSFGPWIMSAYKILSRMKGLRGTPFDLLGYSHERRLERRLIDDYRALIESIVDRLDEQNASAAIELAGAAFEIAGYGHVKAAAVVRYETRLPDLKKAFEMPAPVQQATTLVKMQEIH
jgi:indolepyruvate ferredoxin oxidoreductase